MSGESSVLAPSSGLPELSSLSPCSNECQALQACKTGSFLFWPHLPASPTDMALLITFNLQRCGLGVRGFLAADSAFISSWLWRGSVVAHSRIQPWTCVISSRPLRLRSSWPLFGSQFAVFSVKVEWVFTERPPIAAWSGSHPSGPRWLCCCCDLSSRPVPAEL